MGPPENPLDTWMLIPSYYNWGDERRVYWDEKSHVQLVAGSLLFQPASSIQLLSANSYNTKL